MSREYYEGFDKTQCKVLNEAREEQRVNLVAIEDQLINKVKAGLIYFLSGRWTNVANNDSIYFRCKVGSVKTLHFLLNMNTVGLWQFDSYLDSTYTDDGTLVNPINRHAGKPVDMDSLFYKDPVIDVLGSSRLSFDFGGGTAPARASSTQFNDQLESVFSPNEDLLVKLTNLSGSTQRITAVANVYEEVEL